jgi:hypothetical protein
LSSGFGVEPKTSDFTVVRSNPKSMFLPEDRNPNFP